MTTEEIKKSADLVFLALVVWREGRGEKSECRAGIAYSILNRVNNPKWWGNDILSVVTKKWQYSSMTDPNDKQLTTWPISIDSSWTACLLLADAVLTGQVPNPAKGADSYFDISIPNPKWATEDCFVKQIGRVKFYNLDRDVEK